MRQNNTHEAQNNLSNAKLFFLKRPTSKNTHNSDVTQGSAKELHH
jgi:hypothetical protein